MATIYHIAADSDWRAAQARGRYEADSLDTEGFIHCSNPTQAIWVANTFFRGRTDLVLLCIDEDRVTPDVRYDTSDAGTFPHIYGPLNLDAVTQVLAFPPGAEGSFSLPPEAHAR